MTIDTAPAELVLGIDIGTSGVRIAALDRDLALVGLASTSMVSPDRIEGHVRQDAVVWWDAVSACMSLLAGSVDLSRVRAVAVDGTSGTILAIDRDGTPLAPASLYNDTAEPATVARVDGLLPKGSAGRGASSALARALDLFRAVPDAHRIVHQADWIAGRLAGRFDWSDENNALKTGYDPVARRWPDAVEAAGLPLTLLPAVLPAGSPVGPVADRDRLGLSPGTLVVAGTTDGCAAFLATGASEAGDGVTSLGTTLVIKLLSDEPIAAADFGIYSHRIGDTWLAGGASNSGGAALLAHFSAERMAALQPQLRPTISTGLDFYPLPAPGERFPINDPALPPRVEPRPADEATFFQALLEGVAGVEALGYRRLSELGGPTLRSVRTVGGGARNAAWTAMREARLGVPMLPPAHNEAACGTARLAWRGLLASRGLDAVVAGAPSEPRR